MRLERAASLTLLTVPCQLTGGITQRWVRSPKLLVSPERHAEMNHFLSKWPQPQASNLILLGKPLLPFHPCVRGGFPSHRTGPGPDSNSLGQNGRHPYRTT